MSDSFSYSTYRIVNISDKTENNTEAYINEALKRIKEKLIADIIDSDYDTEEKTLRILSIDAEKRNRKICDYVIHNDTIEGERVSGEEEIRRLILLEGEKY